MYVHDSTMVSSEIARLHGGAIVPAFEIIRVNNSVTIVPASEIPRVHGVVRNAFPSHVHR